MKTHKLPDSLLVALAQYYINRARQNLNLAESKTDNKTFRRTWNKEEDCDRVFEAATKAGLYNHASCAGTFWFSTQNESYEISESTYPLSHIL